MPLYSVLYSWGLFGYIIIEHIVFTVIDLPMSLMKSVVSTSTFDPPYKEGRV